MKKVSLRNKKKSQQLLRPLFPLGSFWTLMVKLSCFLQYSSDIKWQASVRLSFISPSTQANLHCLCSIQLCLTVSILSASVNLFTLLPFGTGAAAYVGQLVVLMKLPDHWKTFSVRTKTKLSKASHQILKLSFLGCSFRFLILTSPYPSHFFIRPCITPFCVSSLFALHLLKVG